MQKMTADCAPPVDIFKPALPRISVRAPGPDVTGGHKVRTIFRASKHDFRTCMASFIYDTRNHSREEFWRSPPPQNLNGSDRCLVGVLEWPSGAFSVMITPDKRSEHCYLAQTLTPMSVTKLLERRPRQLRIMSVNPCSSGLCAETGGRFAPLDFVDPKLPERTYGLQAIYKHFRVPTEFIVERLHSVTHSFGSYQDDHRGSQAYGKPS